MEPQLYFICPTDHLEHIINDQLGGVNYFYFSLGNSLGFDVETLEQLSSFLNEKRIENISFVLSDSNQLVLDAIQRQGGVQFKGLENLYDGIRREKVLSSSLWKGKSLEIALVAQYLKSRVKDLESKFSETLNADLNITALLYDSKNKQFKSLYSDFIYTECIRMN